jgi:hypothetical protein
MGDLGTLCGVTLFTDVSMLADDKSQEQMFVEAMPSSELLERINKLPKGSHIAVHDFSPEDLIRLDGIGEDIGMEAESGAYWSHIYEAAPHLNITYLESPQIFLERVKLARRQKAINEAQAKDPRQELARQSFITTAKFEYVSIVAHIAQTVDKIQGVAPALSIVFDVQANTMMRRWPKLFKAYQREEFPHTWLRKMLEGANASGQYGVSQLALYCNENIQPNIFTENATVRPDMLQYNNIIRAYNAATKHCITGGRPDYRGDFGVPEWVFEIFTKTWNGRRFEGKFEHAFGVDPCRGEVSREHIEFVRTMKRGKSVTEMHFAADRSGAVYKGGFKHPDSEGIFTLYCPSNA